MKSKSILSCPDHICFILIDLSYRGKRKVRINKWESEPVQQEWLYHIPASSPAPLPKRLTLHGFPIYQFTVTPLIPQQTRLDCNQRKTRAPCGPAHLTSQWDTSICTVSTCDINYCKSSSFCISLSPDHLQSKLDHTQFKIFNKEREKSIFYNCILVWSFRMSLKQSALACPCLLHFGSVLRGVQQLIHFRGT